MQIDPCQFCGEPALAYYPLERVDALGARVEDVRRPVCEPHRAWLAAAAGRGRTLPDGVRWRLLEPDDGP